MCVCFVGGSRVKLLNTKCDSVLIPRDITSGLRPDGPLDKFKKAITRVGSQKIMLQHDNIAASTAVSKNGHTATPTMNIKYVRYSCACPTFT